MELQFQKNVCSCLKAVLREVQNAEQSQELRIPDGMPDIGKVLCAWGQCVLRSKEWRLNSIGISAGMMVWVLYTSEDENRLLCLEGWIPFQMNWELPEGAAEGDIRVACRVRFVDARSVSPRKIMIRAGMGALAEGWTRDEAEVYTTDSLPEDVQVLKNTYPVRLPREAGEKSFSLEEELMVPGSAPQPEKLIYYRMNPVITDRKVLANKTVFRGNGNLHVLYQSEEGQLHGWDFDVPFSQYQDLKHSHSTEARADVQISTTGLELELDDEGHMRLKAGMTAQYLVDDMDMLEVVEDAYSPVRELGIRQEKLELPVVLDSRQENVYGESTVSGEMNLVVDSTLMTDFPIVRSTMDGVTVELPGQLQLLCYDAEGKPVCASQRWEGRCSVKAAPESDVSAGFTSNGDLQVSPGMNSVNVQADIPMEIISRSGGGIPMVTGLELGSPKEADPGRPSLVLRRAGGDRLWDLAKRTGSTAEAIRSANGLQEEPDSERMLLIPVS